MTLHELTEKYEAYRAAKDAATLAMDDFEKAQFEAAQAIPDKTRVYLGCCGGYAVIFRGHGDTARGFLFDFIPAAGGDE